MLARPVTVKDPDTIAEPDTSSLAFAVIFPIATLFPFGCNDKGNNSASFASLCT